MDFQNIKDENIREFYNRDYKVFSADNQNEIEISIEGSLGLLASGYEGLIALRKVRQKYKTQK
jgi:hypothetical protein